jgi:hypothetical protein
MKAHSGFYHILLVCALPPRELPPTLTTHVPPPPPQEMHRQCLVEHGVDLVDHIVARAGMNHTTPCHAITAGPSCYCACADSRALTSRERPNEAGGVHGPQHGRGDCSHGGLPGGGALPGLPHAALPGTSGLSALRPPHLHRLAQLRTALPHPTVRPLSVAPPPTTTTT